MGPCPKCKGKGFTVVKIEVEVKLKCLTCRGKGEITEAQLDAINRGDEWWCSCAQSSGQDYEHDTLFNKHRWICRDCGGTTKLG